MRLVACSLYLSGAALAGSARVLFIAARVTAKVASRLAGAASVAAGERR